jgi:predicted NAD/FAD-binding protein
MLDASPAERAVLGAFRYQPNRAVLHTDVALLPRRRSTWSAWNYLAEGGHTPEASGPVAVSYLLNMLQPLPFKRPVIVTLNPTREPAAGTVLRTFDYEHPVFDVAAIQAQARVADIQGRDGVYFCGAWTRYGFHEDGLMSGMDVASRLGVTAPWKEAICQPA